MAIFNLGENNEAVVLRFDEVDTIIAPSSGIDYLVNNFQTEDRIDISGISQTAQGLIETAQELAGAVRLIGDFGQMTLIGITRDQLRPENFISNSAPSASDDFAVTTEGIAIGISVLDNDSDPNGEPISISGFPTFTGFGGTVNIDPNTGDLLYQPQSGFVGTDSFTYTIADSAGLTSTAVVSVNVQGRPNIPPIAEDDFSSTSEGIPVSIAVLNNDSDPDFGPQPLFISEFPIATVNGIVTSDGDNLVYTPDLGFTGTDSFSYTVSDGLSIDTATVSVTVAPINLPPFAQDDLAVTTENIPLDIFVLDNDFDPEGETPEIIGVPTETALGGSVSINNGSVQYTPEFEFTGTDSFTYTITDSLGQTDTAIVTVQVVGIPNVPPVAVDDFESTDEDVPVAIGVLDNDFDLDGDILAITDFAETSEFGGNVVIDNNGTPFESSDDSLVYTPGFGFTGTDSFNYTISDGQESDTATVTVTVVDVNEPPTAVEDFVATFEGTPVDVFVTDNDFDSDGDPFFILGAEAAGNDGIVTLDDNGTPDDLRDDFLVYSPDPDFTGTDSFTYTIADIFAATDTATVTVAVSQVPNLAPIAQDDFAATRQGEAVEIAVLLNDSDPDLFDSISIVGFPTETASGGTVAIDNDDLLVYEPGADFTGTDSFIYTIADIAGATDTATVTVEVDPQGAPIAVDDSATTEEEQAVEIDVLSNDSDPDGDPLSITGVQTETPEGGTVTIDDNGSPFNPSDDLLVYEPGGDFTGTDSFIYTISDGLDTATATVTVAVEPINNAPVALPDFDSTDRNMDVEIAVLDNDFDIDGDILEIAEFSETTVEDGTVSLDETSGELVYSPAPEFTGIDSFSYTISDGQGGTDSTTVTVAVEIGNFAPIAADDTAMVTEGMDVTIAVLENDSDPDGPEALSIAGVSETAEGGTISIDEETVIYTPPDVSGTITDSFTYTISDGLETDTATVSVTVFPDINEAPMAADDTAMVTEGMDVTIEVLNNDSDEDEDPLEISGVSDTAEGGTVSIDGETVVYTPPDVSETITDSFTYTISDGELTDTATVNVTVFPENEAPIAGDDTAITTESIAATIAVLDNDSDPDGDELSIVIDDFPIATAEGGTVTLDNGGTPFNPTDDSLVYEAADGFIGTDSFTYTISDGVLTGTATVSVTVEPPENIPPIALEDFTETTAGSPVRISVLDDDFDPDGDPVSLDNFVRTTDNGGTIVRDNNGTQGNRTDDALVYTPAEGFTGTDLFAYTIVDGQGGTAFATVNVTVVEDNSDPIAEDDTALTSEGIAATIAVLENDSDPDDDPVQLANFERVTLNGSTIVRDNNGTPGEFADDLLVYTPAEDFVGTDSFTYTVNDGRNGTASATVTVTVEPDNIPPIAADDATMVTEGMDVTIAVLENDSDPDNGPEALSIAVGSATAEGGTVVIDGETVVYTPPAVSETITDSFTYTISDGDLTDTATVNVTVAPENEAPIAVDDTTSTSEGIVTIAVLENDSDPDGDELSIVIDDFPIATENGGTVSIDNGGTPLDTIDDSLVYEPADGFTGPDSFTYTISDGELSDTATVNVTVIGVNEPPIATNDEATTTENIAATIAVVENDSDPDGDLFFVSDFASTTGNGGSVTLDNNDTPDDLSDDLLVYTPGPGFTGTDSFTYTIADIAGATDSATVTVTVDQGNVPPIALPDITETVANSAVVVDVTDNDFDLDGDVIQVTDVSETTSAGGTVAIGEDNQVTYTPAEDFVGPDSFTYTIADEAGATGTATVSVIVAPGNADPVAMDDEAATTSGISATIMVLDNDSDPDGDPISLEEFAATTENGGTITRTDDSLVYSASETFLGTDSFAYTISDGQGGTASATVTVTVEAPFDLVANDLNVVSRQDTEVRIPVLINDEPADESLTVTEVGEPDSGTGETAVVENQVVYTPADGIGEDSFSYSISDSFNRTETAVVDVNLQPLGAALTGSPEDDLIIGDDLPAEFPPEGGSIILETLEGGQGDDTLIGNQGTDILVGGPGADEFVYLSLNDSNSTDIAGGDTIDDFNPTEDKIRLDFEIDGEPISNEDVTIGDFGIQFGTARILIAADPTFQITLLFEPGTTVGQIEDSLEFGGIQ